MRGRGGKSNRAIMSELFAKGVDREVANQVLEESADSELARLKILIAKKQRLSRYQKDPAKLMQYLVTQGFNWQLVKQELNNTDPED